MKNLLRHLAQPLRGLLWQLFVFIVLPLTALLIVFTFGSLSMHQNAMRSLVGERDQRLVSTAAAAIGSQLDERVLLLRSLARQGGSAVPPASLDEILSSSGLLPAFDYGLAFYDLKGNLLASRGDAALWAALSAQAAFPALLEQATPQGILSDKLSLPVGGKPVVLILARLPDAAAQPARVALGALSPQSLVQKIVAQAFAPGDQTNILLVDPTGTLIYSNAAQAFGKDPSSHAGVAEALQGKTGTAYVQAEDRSEHVVAYAPTQPLGWALVTEESWETVASPTLQTTQVAPLVLIPVLLVMLAALWFSVYQIVRPLQALETSAAQVAWGDFQAIEKPVGGIAEIRHLQAELVHLTRKVQAAQESLHSYIGAITAGQEEERRRLARDLHDDTLQALIALKQRLQLAHLDLESGAAGDSTLARLAELEGMAEGTIQELRRVTRALRPIYLEDLGLATALQMLAREVGQNAPLPVTFDRQGTEQQEGHPPHLAVTFELQGTEQRLSPVAELGLYRMAQEALSNVVRHAQATQAAVTLRYAPDEITLIIADNGKGFRLPKSPAEFAPSGHYGLLGLQERAELIGARLQISSALGAGSRLTVRLPLSKPPGAPSGQGGT